MSGLIKISMMDATPSFRLGGAIRPLLTPKSVGADGGFLGTMTLRSGEFIAEHRHPYSEEFIFVAEGTVVLKVDGDEIELNRHEAAMVPKFGSHRIENRAEQTALVVFQIAPLAPSPEQGHIEVEPPPFPDADPPRVGE